MSEVEQLKLDGQWTPQRVVDRVLANMIIDENGCWVSQYRSVVKGYAYVGFSENGVVQSRRVHRVVWIHFNGRIPDDLCVDHMCRNRRCINPEHLRLLTLAENSRDIRHYNIAKTHCPRGHPYAGDNLITHRSSIRSRPSRACRICRDAWNANRPRRSILTPSPEPSDE